MWLDARSFSREKGTVIYIHIEDEAGHSFSPLQMGIPLQNVIP